MAYRVTAKVYTQRAEARLSKYMKGIEDSGQATIQDLVNIGKETARVLVPKDKKLWLYSQISGKVLKRSGQIYLRNEILPKSHRLFKRTDFPQFNLARWMHETDGRFKTNNPFGKAGTKHIKSGDPRFMYTTAEILNVKKKDVAKKNFKIKV